MSAPRALVSIGTNSTRLLVLDGDRVLTAQSTGTRLGAGLGRSGALDPDARARTLAVIAGYVAAVRGYGAAIDAIATSALRRADDAAAFTEDVRALTGVVPRILSGAEEAAFSFRGATGSLDGPDRVAVLDVGGGSTELAAGTRGRIERTASLEIGAVRLSERHPALLGARALAPADRAALVAAAEADAHAVLAPLHSFAATFDELIAVGGTVFTAAAMLARDPARDGVALARTDRRAVVDDLLALDLDARRAMPFIRPQRADILPAGLIVVDVACELLGVDVLRVSHADLLAGYLRSPEYRPHALPGTGAVER